MRLGSRWPLLYSWKSPVVAMVLSLAREKERVALHYLASDHALSLRHPPLRLALLDRQK